MNSQTRARKSSSKASKSSKRSAKSSKKSTKSAPQSLQARLVGTWRLVSAEDFDSQSGKWIPYTFGNPPSGYFFYDATGYASIQIMTTPPQKITSDPPPAEQALAIYNNYIAYYGTYTVDETNIYHQVEGAWDPTQVGTVQTRPYQLNGNQLIIGDQVNYKRLLVRVT